MPKIQQPKPNSKDYNDLITEIEKGEIKIPKFQRDFVWSIDKVAQLLDSILKGYPIGTFILWETNERLSDIKKIGNLSLPEPPDNKEIQYVLDGQQRITSLFAAYRRATVEKEGKKTDYSQISVDLDKDISDNDNPIITAIPESRSDNSSVSLSDVLNFSYAKSKELKDKRFTSEQIDLIYDYSQAFKTYQFSVVTLRKNDINSAVEVFTRINTGGQQLTLFEIMCAKTYDESKEFDMQKKWEAFDDKVGEKCKYEGISSIVVLQLLSLVISKTKECKRKVILSLNKDNIIEKWDSVISALEDAIDYFRQIYRIPVSKLLPYDSLLVPFAYFFYKNRSETPNQIQEKFLQEFFWRVSLSQRYSSATQSKMTQDIKRIEAIIDNKHPSYDSDFKIHLEEKQDLINTNFRTGSSYCKAILCLLAYYEPKDFDNNGKVILNNEWLKVPASKNYHHFFPKAYLKEVGKEHANSIVNITLVSDRLNKREIKAKEPGEYIAKFKERNPNLKNTLETHLIDLENMGIQNNNYELFLEKRAEKIYQAIKDRIEI